MALIARNSARNRLVVAALVALCAVTTVLVHRQDTAPAVMASSSAPGTRPQRLLDPFPESPAPERPVTWASDGETVGAWLSLQWARPTTVGTVRLYAAGDISTAPRSVLLGFDDGSSLLVTADADGDAVVSFPERATSRLRITVAEVVPGAQRVALAAVSVGDGGSEGFAEPTDVEAVEIDASSGLEGGGRALLDGEAETGEAGGEWVADAHDSSPWVRMRWPQPVEVASVQVLGPSATAVDPRFPAASELSGVLRFDDGSDVVISGIEGGHGQPTTIAFAPRVVTSMRLELTRTVATADAALRELRVHGAGTTPPRWPAPGRGYAVQPPVADCGAAGTATALPADGPVLICPRPGSEVSGTDTIVVGATGGTVLRASAPSTASASAAPSMRPAAEAIAGPDNRAVLRLDTGEMPRGPVTVMVQADGEEQSEALPVQLFNTGGRRVASPGFAAPGLTLQWEDDFEEPLSISRTGEGAVYAAGKPTFAGPTTFGAAAFADPALGAGLAATVDGYLRLRAEPTAGRVGAAPHGEEYLSGMVSSLRSGAGGFAAQYGYFEARMMGAPGDGSWPAFWTLNTQAATRDDDVVGEADAAELYGHNPVGSCHVVHHYAPHFEDGQRADGVCLRDNGFAPWTTTWHTYGMRIVPNGAVYFIDGQEVAELAELGRYDEPFFFMLNLALGGGWPIDLAATGGTTDLYVDWVRVYT